MSWLWQTTFIQNKISSRNFYVKILAVNECWGGGSGKGRRGTGVFSCSLHPSLHVSSSRPSFFSFFPVSVSVPNVVFHGSFSLSLRFWSIDINHRPSRPGFYDLEIFNAASRSNQSACHYCEDVHLIRRNMPSAWRRTSFKWTLSSIFSNT